MKPLLVVILISQAVVVSCTAPKFEAAPKIQTENKPPAATSATSSASASNCSLNKSQAPVVSGLKLGITQDEVLALFPGSKDDPEVRSQISRAPGRFGNSSFIIRPEKFENKSEFAGISQITFELLDGRVSSVTVNYNGPVWPHVDQFVAKFVEGKNLPPADQWEAYVGMDNQMKTLTCTDFMIRLFAGGEGGNLNYVLMQDLEADKKLKERRKKAREQASPTPESH